MFISYYNNDTFYCGLAWRVACYQSRNATESKGRPLQLVAGWVTTRVRSGKNLVTHIRVANQPWTYRTNPTVSTLPT